MSDEETQGTPADTTPDVGNDQPPSDGKDWKKSYAGLQTAYNRLKESSTTEAANLQKELADALAKVEELTAEAGQKGKSLEKSAEELKSLSEQLVEATTAVERQRARNDRTQLIMRDFPELAQFEADGLLPSVEGSEEEMRQVFEKFQARLSSTTGDALKKKIAGATPHTANNNTPSPQMEDEDYIFEKMMEAAGVPGKENDFAAWQAKYDQLQLER